MRVNVTKAFPYSPHGYDVEHAEVGVQDLPDDIAALAIAEGWAIGAAAPTPPADDATPEEQRRLALSTFTHTRNVEEVSETLKTITNAEELELIEDGEHEHPDFKPGRKGVLDAIDKRFDELTAPPPAGKP